MEAGANRDFAPLHFDRDAARAEGLPDVFADTMLLQAPGILRPVGCVLL